jgi:hypothetical protein
MVECWCNSAVVWSECMNPPYLHDVVVEDCHIAQQAVTCCDVSMYPGPARAIRSRLWLGNWSFTAVLVCMDIMSGDSHGCSVEMSASWSEAVACSFLTDVLRDDVHLQWQFARRLRHWLVGRPPPCDFGGCTGALISVQCSVS